MRAVRTLFFVAVCAMGLARVGFGADIEQRGLRTIPREVGGRKVDAWWQPGEKDRGEPNDVRNLVLVKHPVAAKD